MKTDDRMTVPPLPGADLHTSSIVYLPMLCLGLLGFGLGLIFYRNAPGSDLMVFHTAGRLAELGDYATLADGSRFTELLVKTHQAWLRVPPGLHPWVYPPTMLPFAMMIGAFPFGFIYPVMIAASLIVLLSCMARCWPTGSARDLAILLVVLSPGTGWCIGAGQVSFIAASIILAGLAVLRRRGLAAGLVLSLLTLKPQFALLVPVALVCGGNRRACIGFTLGAAALLALSVAMLGADPWLSWIHFISGTDAHFAAWQETGRYSGQSMDAHLLVLGFSSRIAGVGQLIASLAAAGIVGWSFATILDTRRRMIVFMVAATLGAPHISNYDAVLSALAAALVLTSPRQVRRPGITIVAILVWSSALVNPPFVMKALGIPALAILSAATPPLLFLFAIMTIIARSELPATIGSDRA